MSKIFEATCEAGVVKINGFVVDVAILGAGVEPSEGIVILDGSQGYYLAAGTNDLTRTLDQIIDAITAVAATFTTIATSLTNIGAGMTGPTTAPPPTLAVDVASINTKVGELNATKADLEALKGDLT